MSKNDICFPVALRREEGVRDVDGVVDAGSDADDVAHGGEGVDGHAQGGVAQPHHVHQREQDAGQDEEAGARVRQRGSHDDQHDEQRRREVAEHLAEQDLLNLPL